MRYKDIELIEKKRIVSTEKDNLRFQKKYRDFQKENINEEIEKKIFSILLKNGISNNDVIDEEKLSQFVLENNSEDIYIISQYTVELENVQELFLLTYGEDLCKLIYENAEVINYEPENEEIEEYLSFLKEVMKFFFTKKKELSEQIENLTNLFSQYTPKGSPSINVLYPANSGEEQLDHLVTQCAKHNMGDKKTIEDNFTVLDCVQWMCNIKYDSFCEYELNRQIQERNK